MRAIYKKELKSYFTSAIAWVFLAFFLVLTGLFFFLYNLSGGSLNFSTVYGAIEIFFILLLIPVLTMKSMADEKHQKTDQLLYTSPISINKVVLGKYLALVTLFAIGLLIVSLYPIILQNLVKYFLHGKLCGCLWQHAWLLFDGMCLHCHWRVCFFFDGESGDCSRCYWCYQYFHDADDKSCKYASIQQNFYGMFLRSLNCFAGICLEFLDS